MDLSWLMLIAVVAVVYAILVGIGSGPSPEEIVRRETELEILYKLNRMVDLVTLKTRAELQGHVALAARVQEELNELEADVSRLNKEREDLKK